MISIPGAKGTRRLVLIHLRRLHGKLLWGASDHAMVYIHSGVEDIPLPDETFEIISSINNLGEWVDPIMYKSYVILKPTARSRHQPRRSRE